MRDPLVADDDLLIYQGDCLAVLREMETGVAEACVTSPPYLDARPEYGTPSPEEFVLIFQELRRVVSGPLLLNVGRLWRKRKEVRWWEPLVEGAESAGWDHSDTLIWTKGNANPIRGRVLTDAHEYVYLFGEGFNVDGIRTPYTPEGIARMSRKWKSGSTVKGEHKEQQSRKLNPLGARPRSVFASDVGREKGNPHPAPMAGDLANHLVLLAARPGETILDPFGGSGTTAVAARANGRKSILIELSQEYAEIAAGRLSQQTLIA